jgi:aromatic-L-amino-acid decarboxylase
MRAVSGERAPGKRSSKKPIVWDKMRPPVTHPDPQDPAGLEPHRVIADGWLQAAGRFLLDQIDGLERAPAGGLPASAAASIAAAVSRPIAEEPLAGGMDEALALLERAASVSLCAPGPGYLAYVPGGGIYAAALADLLADGLNRYTGMPEPSPALFRLEQDVLQWLCAQFGYGAEARAVLTPGGSSATLNAVVAARQAHFGDSGDFQRAIAYTSSEAHNSVAKSARTAGIPAGNLRVLPVDERFRLRPEALAAALAEDRRQGLRPFLLVAAAGTTSTGAVDPLPALADLCAEQGLWLHVDAAYGGAFVFTPAGRARLAGIERADSISFDPHKGMFLPYGTGCLLARRGETLRQAFSQSAVYLHDLAQRSIAIASATGGESEVTWSPAELGPELSRDFRGLRLWLPLMLHGAGAFRREIAEKLELAERFVAGLDRLIAAGMPIEIVARPQLSLVAFRLRRRAGEAFADWDARNVAWLAAINGRQRVHLSSTRLPTADGPAFTLRVCVLSFRTHARHIDFCLEDLASTVG